MKARRVVLDSIDTLFSGLPNEAILRSELRRLFVWLKDRKLSTIITAERGDPGLTRHGIEEYVSDCVIVLEQRVQDELATRRLRVVKYRGSAHGTNEYPFLIENSGLTLLPVTSLGLSHTVSEKRVSSGIPGLDSMLDGKGYYQGSSILITGGPGTGKTSIAAHFAVGCVKAGQRCLYYAFEESAPQLVRNMHSIGIDLAPAIATKSLEIKSVRPTTHRSMLAIANIRRICEQYLHGRYDLEVIDISQHPELAAGEQIIAVPTLIKKLPIPLRRFIGDLSQTQNIIRGLDLYEADGQRETKPH